MTDRKMETGQTDFVLTRSRAATSTGATSTGATSSTNNRAACNRTVSRRTPRGRREPTTIGIPHIPWA